MRTVLLALLAALLLTDVAAAARGWGAPEPVDLPTGEYQPAVAMTAGGIAVSWATAGPAAERRVWGAVLPGMAPTELGPGHKPLVRASKASGRVVFTWTRGSGDAGDDDTFARVLESGQLEDTVELGRHDGYQPALDVHSWGHVALATGLAGKVVLRQRASFDGWQAPLDLGPGRPIAVGAGLNGAAVVVYEREDGFRVARVSGRSVVSDLPLTDFGLPGRPADIGVADRVPMTDTGEALLVLQAPMPTSPDGPAPPLHVLRGTADGAWHRVPDVPSAALKAIAGTAGGSVGTVVWADALGAVRALTGDLATGAFGSPELLDPGAGGLRHVDMSLDGTSLVTTGGAGTLRTVRRDGFGAFQAPRSMSCPGDGSDVVAAGLAGPLTGVLVYGLDPYSRLRSLRLVRDEPAAAASDVRCATAGGGQPPAGGPGMPGTAPPASRPKLGAVAGQRLRGVLRRGLRLGVVVPQAGRPTVSLVVPRRQARRLRIGRRATLIGRRAVSLRAGANAVTVPIAKRVRRKLAKARRLTVTVNVTSPYGLILTTKVALRR